MNNDTILANDETSDSDASESNVIECIFPKHDLPRRGFADPFLANNKWHSISQLRISDVTSQIIILEGSLERERMHRQYGEPELPKYFRCSTPQCSWCRYIQVADSYFLVPVFSMDLGEVCVLFDRDPDTVKTSIIGELKRFIRLGGTGHRIISIRREGYAKYHATSTLIPVDSDIGFDVAECFIESRRAKEVTLASAFWRPTQEELLDIPIVMRTKALMDAQELAVEPFPIDAGGDR